MSTQTPQPVLINGNWRPADAVSFFTTHNPATGEPLPHIYPISKWSDCEAVLQGAVAAFENMLTLPAERRAAFLERYADRIETRKEELVQAAHCETGYPKVPRLADVELPRTTSQLRLAAAACREGSWAMPTIDTKLQIRSMYLSLGPVCVFGPNNFPFAFGSISGGDFAAAFAAGNPVIAKANTSHPRTTQLFAEEAQLAATECDLPPGCVQLIYRTSHQDGERLVADHRIGATAYTGSRSAGLKLKGAADAAGKPIYLELSSINPVVILPGALAERSDKILDEFCTSSLMGTGQFCTNPGMVILLKGPRTDAFIEGASKRYHESPCGALLSQGVQSNLKSSVEALQVGGASVVTGGSISKAAGYRFDNTLLKVSAAQFLKSHDALQIEAFGNASLFVVADTPEEITSLLHSLEGNLTGCIYSDTQASDDGLYGQIAPILRRKVGRLLNDKMPTGVAVSSAMNHGGPYPATGHPGFTAVGIPASLLRFGMLACYDGVRPHRLPRELANEHPGGGMWRRIDGVWTQGNVS